MAEVMHSCGKGRMRPSGVMLMSIPPQYPHACDYCQAPITLLTRYPASGYKPVAGAEWVPTNRPAK